MLGSCIYDDPDPCRPCDDISVTVSVCSDRMETLTRTTDEDAVADVNLYLFGRSNASAVHVYSASDMLAFKCKPDEYDVYVLANMHEDLGEMTAMQLEEYSLAQRDFDASLPMTGRTTIRISAGNSSYSLPPIKVTRAVAKVSYAIRVEAADIELQSVQLCSVPRLAFPFTAAAPSAAAADYTQGAPAMHAGDEASGACYMLPNLQGTNMSITEQRQKNRDNAPEHASYLLIRALRGGKVLAYRVYLGENNTSDFNVRANNHYRLRISIRNDDEADARIDSYEVAVWDDFEEQSLEGLCYAAENGRLHVDIAFRGEQPDLQAAIRVVEGDAASLHLEGAALTEPRNLDLEDESSSLAIEYTPACFDDTNRRLVYVVDVTDAHGIVRTFEIGHTFANSLEANVWSRSTTNGEGTIRIEGHAAECEVSPLTHNRLVLCREGCVLTAEPAAGCTFEGWYADDRFKVPVAATPQYRYVAKGRHGVLYAKFKRIEATPLDTSGTANCYLAPQLGTWYSFNARVMGNGKATLNITPQPLSGTTARVIWETGTEKGAVIKSVRCENGRIFFSTGSKCGNALIGLFDVDDECVWSWHIWAINNYDPEIGYHTYKSGKVFMMRNLGALSSDCNDVKSRGLYYQWGRKDPFLGPASISDFSGTTSAVYHMSNYEYSRIYPQEYEPEEIMDIAWATAHPTTFIVTAIYPDWDDHSDILDWLFTRHPNLWGNRTTGNPVNRNSSKSIYDPCPPGWRVPDLQDFKDIMHFTDNTPYYTSVLVGADLARFPMGGSFNGSGFMSNGSLGRVYTCSPYIGSKSSNSLGYAEYDCASIYFSKSDIGCTSALRSYANPVRCIKE